MSLRVFLVFGLCAFLIAAGGGATAVSLAPPAPPRLRPAPGWTSIRSLLISVSPRRSEPAASQASVIAATAADAARLSPLALFNSLTRLRRGGIVVMATTIGRHRPSFHFARVRFPLRLSSFRVDHGWENQPAANIQQRLCGHSRWVGSRRARLLRHPAPRSEALGGGASRTRSAAPPVALNHRGACFTARR
jgi:hypothetical protein